MDEAVVRRARVEADRIEGWVARFGARHGGCSLIGPDTGGEVEVVGGDGCTARLTPVVTSVPVAGLSGPIAWLAGADRLPSQIAIVGIRRAEYAVALVDHGAVTASKHGRRHVQGRTAAGGWSQQRFARRRANAADALVDDVAGHVVTLVLPTLSSGAVWVGAGDRALVTAVLEDLPTGKSPVAQPVGYVDVAALDATFVRGLPRMVGALSAVVQEYGDHAPPIRT